MNKRTRSTSGTAKRYSALFTCMNTRAVHLELTGDMPKDSFIFAHCRFKARRGHPKSIWSDNRNNFIGAERELKDALSKLDEKKIINELNESRIQWTFNPAKSPWMGGAMEALVKITKGCLKVTWRRITHAIFRNWKHSDQYTFNVCKWRHWWFGTTNTKLCIRRGNVNKKFCDF